MDPEVSNKKRILLVDDDEFLSDIYSKKFEEMGMEVVSKRDGQSALDILEKGDNFDFIVFDMTMPSMSGLEFLENMNKKGFAKDSKKVVLSNESSDDDIEKAKQAGADDYIVKANTVPSEVFERITSLS